MEHKKSQVNIPKVDLRLLLTDLLHVAGRLIWLGVLFAVLLGFAFGLRAHRSYAPSYRAEATFTVTVTNPLYSSVKSYNLAAAEQMAKTFPYILSSDVLGGLVRDRLGVESLPSITASVLPNTNIFTLTVTSGNPQTAYNTLQAFMDCYPEVAERVVGPTKMNLLSES
jgi:capsular polysaccharide biosynthesis protein